MSLGSNSLLWLPFQVVKRGLEAYSSFILQELNPTFYEMMGQPFFSLFATPLCPLLCPLKPLTRLRPSQSSFNFVLNRPTTTTTTKIPIRDLGNLRQRTREITFTFKLSEESYLSFLSTLLKEHGYMKYIPMPSQA